MHPCPMGTFLYAIQPGDTLWLLAQRYNTTVYAITAANPGVDPKNLYVGEVIYLCLGYGYYPPGPGLATVSAGISKAEMDLKSYMRMLWEEHIAWTRMAIISIAYNLPDQDLVIKRLLRNATDMEAAFKPLYGDEKASRFGSLMKDHLVTAAQLVNAAKAGDSKAAADAEKKWYANADEIAAFLNTINPNWPKEALMIMLHGHLALTKSEAVARLTRDYATDIALYDKIEKQALTMADALTEGIVKQFPDKFIM